LLTLVGHEPGAKATVLYRRNFDQLVGAVIPGTEEANSPFFSPDGKWVGFFTDSGTVKKVALNGGIAVTLGSGNGARFAAGAWLDNGTIVYSGVDGISRVSSAGGAPVVIPHAPEISYFWPSALPGSARVLVLRCSDRCEKHDLVALDIKSGRATVIIPGGTSGWYIEGGMLA
jgi:hypothetical protein